MTVSDAARAEGKRALSSVTRPKGKLHKAMATYIPGGLVNSGSPYRLGTSQLPVRKLPSAMMDSRISVCHNFTPAHPYTKMKPHLSTHTYYHMRHRRTI